MRNSRDDYADDISIEKTERSSNKFIKKKKENRDYSWNHDISLALRNAGYNVKEDRS